MSDRDFHAPRHVLVGDVLSFLGDKNTHESIHRRQAPGRGRGKSELAQLWKDMKRDTVSINGRVMTGEQGPEGIIGALTRCILAQVREVVWCFSPVPQFCRLSRSAFHRRSMTSHAIGVGPNRLMRCMSLCSSSHNHNRLVA